MYNATTMAGSYFAVLATAAVQSPCYLHGHCAISDMGGSRPASSNDRRALVQVCARAGKHRLQKVIEGQLQPPPKHAGRHMPVT